MNMHTPITAKPDTGNTLACAHELLVTALDLIDELTVPGQIGANVDHAIQMLRALRWPQEAALPEELPA